jgi:ribosomal protein S17E
MAEANMAAVERIKAAKSKSLRLMQMDKKLDAMAKGARGEITESFSSSEPVAPQKMMSTKIDKSMGIPTGGRMNENVPLAIREAFQNNPIDESQLLMSTMSGGGDLSFLNENIVRPTTTVPVMENTQQMQPQIQTVGTGVDYPMIRTIVEEIVRKYAQSLNKRIVNENKETVNEVNTIALGKTFKFLAKNGDIYEAKLTKVGNINDKRKSVTD